jgi:ubiquinone/menaquinone biosynthesis C-methylase UbiE
MLQETIEKPATKCRNDSGWRSQFAHPLGWRGWVVGQLMAIKNKERSLWVLSLFNLHPEDRVLEIGFGSGADTRRVAERVPMGFVPGIDHSDVMLRQATRRNKETIQAGRFELRQGTASELPYASDSFRVAFAVNVAQFWDAPTDTLREIRRVLKPAG